MEKKLIISVDGYSSCGKSTFAKMIAKEMGYLFIDSGAMYRTVTLYAIRNNMVGQDFIKTSDLIASLPQIKIDFRFNADEKRYETYLNNENVEEEIRDLEVSGYVSPISQIKEVREKMVELQREIGVFKGIVMDGRDIGTVVFPDADIKIFMTASPEIRAKRRHDELMAKGREVSLEEILKNINNRDKADSGREFSPLVRADDAIEMDNSHLTVEEQMEMFRTILNRVRDEN